MHSDNHAQIGQNGTFHALQMVRNKVQVPDTIWKAQRYVATMFEKDDRCRAAVKEPPGLGDIHFPASSKQTSNLSLYMFPTVSKHQVHPSVSTVSATCCQQCHEDPDRM